MIYVDKDWTGGYVKDYKVYDWNCDDRLSSRDDLNKLYVALVGTYLKFGLKPEMTIFLELYATLMEAYILFKSDCHLRIFGVLLENVRAST